MAVSANRLELLQIADAVAREKSIDRAIVITAMEDAIAKAARSRYGAETDVHAGIDAKTGELRLSRHMLVVEIVENSSNQISVDDAKKRNPAAQVGDTIADTLPPLEYGRIAAQSAKQVIVQKVREAERDRQYQEYKDRISDIVNGIVKRVEYGNVVVDLGRGAPLGRRDEAPPGEPAAGDLPQRRPHPRLHLRCAAGTARTADISFAYSPTVHGQAVRAGGAGNLRRHRRGEGGSARSRLPRQDRGDLARFLGGPSGCLRRYAGIARAGRGQ